jgi:hypothetical protein
VARYGAVFGSGTDFMSIIMGAYRGVVIYCMPFHVVFSTASLN